MTIDYKNGKIYTLRTYNDDSLIYVGSTCQQLSKRHYEHKRKYKQYLNGTFHYITSYDVIKCGDTYIELLETYPCNTKEELHTREGYWIRKIKCVNRCVVGRTYKQWCEDNKYKIVEQQKQYRIDNREKIRKQKNRYLEDNKDKIREHKKQYYAANKDILNTQRSKKCMCVCGKQYAHSGKARHLRTKRHNKLFLKVIEQRIKEMEKDIIYESSTKIF